MRGGVSAGDYQNNRDSMVFPTCVGVFLLIAVVAPEVAKSSPRAWGCFYFNLLSANPVGVFPTCVGVFPFQFIEFEISVRSSPRAWGCFPLPLQPLL